MKRLNTIVVACLATSLFAGCGTRINIDGDDLATILTDALGALQSRQQALPPVLVDQGDTIVIDATIIVNPSVDIIVSELPNVTLLGFENDTDWDIYVTYYVDDVLQGIYVYQGETLLLEYSCLEVIELISEDDIDPFTGQLVDSFDLTGADFFNPEDFLCGDAFVLNFDPFSVSGRAEVIDLTP